MMSPPYFRFEKKQDAFVVKTRHHNGNVINLLEEYWVKINENMDLTPMFTIETLAFIPFDETKNKISRQLDEDLVLHVTLIDSAANVISDIGNAQLVKNNEGKFEWKDTHISDTIFKEMFWSVWPE